MYSNDRLGTQVTATAWLVERGPLDLPLGFSLRVARGVRTSPA